MSERICPECGVDLDAEPKRDPIKHAKRHWGDIDAIVQSPNANPDVVARIKELKEMA